MICGLSSLLLAFHFLTWQMCENRGNPFVASFALADVRYLSVANIFWLMAKPHNTDKLEPLLHSMCSLLMKT